MCACVSSQFFLSFTTFRQAFRIYYFKAAMQSSDVINSTPILSSSCKPRSQTLDVASLINTTRKSLTSLINCSSRTVGKVASTDNDCICMKIAQMLFKWSRVKGSPPWLVHYPFSTSYLLQPTFQKQFCIKLYLSSFQVIVGQKPWQYPC